MRTSLSTLVYTSQSGDVSGSPAARAAALIHAAAVRSDAPVVTPAPEAPVVAASLPETVKAIHRPHVKRMPARLECDPETLARAAAQDEPFRF